jgi:DNA-binding transcriptional LysR family regulator
MDRSPPDWHLFRAFLAVAREGSLSGAARALGATQPTMGRQVEALERALGTKLFTRSLDGLAPTDAALRLIPSVEAMAAAADAALRAASGEVDEEVGTVRIAASEIVGVEVLPTILADLQVEHPGIVVELSLSNRNEDLLRGDADIAVRMVRPTQGALLARRIGRIDIGLYAHRRYLKRCRAPRQLDDLREHAMIGFDRDPVPARLLESMGTPFDRTLFALRSDSDVAQLAAVRAAIGIGVCQIGVARRDRNLVPVLHAELVFPLEMWLAMHGDLRANRRIRMTFDHLAAHLTQYARSSCRDASGVPARRSVAGRPLPDSGRGSRARTA